MADLLISVSFLFIMLIGVVTLLPSKLFLGKRAFFHKTAIRSPALLLGLYAIYECAMSPEYDIRIDLLFLYPWLYVTVTVGFIRWFLHMRHSGRFKHSA